MPRGLRILRTVGGFDSTCSVQIRFKFWTSRFSSLSVLPNTSPRACTNGISLRLIADRDDSKTELLRFEEGAPEGEFGAAAAAAAAGDDADCSEGEYDGYDAVVVAVEAAETIERCRSWCVVA